MAKPAVQAMGIPCPICDNPESIVLDSRPHEKGIRRRRECVECKVRWTTMEATAKGFYVGRKQ